MIDTIDAEDAWCPPTFTPDSFGRTRFAWWIMAVDSQSTLFRTSYSRWFSSVTPDGLIVGLLTWCTILFR
ncbi:hypothetical protein OHT59_10345 [Streptomyces sp. NBC_00243]|uniref:hypothetical protein n=1 Tax=Streptomyces sp. NBC_00243 TaxID=2975688 RepID=UPI002DDB5D6A|nr:hypothetical protein [Streptomyces sp. NBC_00243]WRZ26231.1 hypothetical protein OHT59_10345 [Streptomyces sp. NBC_00243]